MHGTSGAPRAARAAGRLAAFAVAYFLTAELGHALTIQPRAFATFWAPSGVFLAGLLLAERRHWPILVLAALVPSTASNLLHGRSLGTSLAFFAGNALESLAAAALVG
ncbi:MAG: MASE1 domain-containing protein, partial [Anaeromyxobacteraceae bacterium]|nr:MASE1 domain-containing protein [Anaeromyxobacteraceae bacterium]